MLVCSPLTESGKLRELQPVPICSYSFKIIFVFHFLLFFFLFLLKSTPILWFSPSTMQNESNQAKAYSYIFLKSGLTRFYQNLICDLSLRLLLPCCFNTDIKENCRTSLVCYFTFSWFWRWNCYLGIRNI